MEETNVQRIQQSMSLTAIEANPELSDPALVNNLLSTFGISPIISQSATGELTVVLNVPTPVVIASGAIFTANGQNYTSDAAYAARTNIANVLTDTDRLITQTSATTWAFTINVTAAVPGAAGAVQINTKFIPTIPIPGFVTAYAAEDFIGALDGQTNAQLIAILQEGLSPKAWSNRVSISGTVHNAASVNARFPNILALSIVGMGDPEMVRDQHTIFPISVGGRSDVYARTQGTPQTISLTKTAVLIEVTPTGGIWQLALGRDDAPGFYEAVQITLPANPAATGYAVQADIRGTDLTSGIYVPDILNVTEAAYSRYQTAVIQFLDTDTPTTGLVIGTATQTYLVAVSTMPLIAELQAFLGDRGTIDPGGDCLVKAPIPCFLSVSFTIQTRKNGLTIDTDAIATALSAYVQQLGFPTSLYGSALSRIIEENLPAFSDAGGLDMFGRIRTPAGEDLYIRSSSILTVPDSPQLGVTGRTVGFFLDPSSVAINVIPVSVPSI